MVTSVSWREFSGSLEMKHWLKMLSDQLLKFYNHITLVLTYIVAQHILTAFASADCGLYIWNFQVIFTQCKWKRIGMAEIDNNYAFIFFCHIFIFRGAFRTLSNICGEAFLTHLFPMLPFSLSGNTLKASENLSVFWCFRG